MRDKFSLETYLEARKTARRVAFLFASHMEAGMGEEEGLYILAELFKKNGIEKKWRPSKFRVGKNTLKSFREKSDPGVKLQKEDIYFIDIAPVVNGQEACYGQTFTVGQNPDFAHAQKTSKNIFDQLNELWKEKGLSKEELCLEGKKLAEGQGYLLNQKSEETSDELKPKPIKDLVMEVHLLHKEKPFGAFFEDILL